MLLVHPEIDATMLDKHVKLLETSFVEKDRKPLPRGQLAFLVLGVDPFLSSAQFRGSPALDQSRDILLLYAHIL